MTIVIWLLMGAANIGCSFLHPFEWLGFGNLLIGLGSLCFAAHYLNL